MSLHFAHYNFVRVHRTLRVTPAMEELVSDRLYSVKNIPALAFYEAIVGRRPRPKFSWSFEPDGSIQVKTETQPIAAAQWQAANPVARDSRLEAIGASRRPRTLIRVSHARSKCGMSWPL